MSVAKRTDLSAGEPPSAVWHTLAAAEVLAALESREAGLTEAEAQFRLASVGPNLLPQQPPPTVWQIFLRQFRSPLIYLLLAATVVSLVIGHFDDAVFIAAVLLINAVIGTIQEWKAEQSSRALQKLLRIRATVVRDGEVKEIPADQVVPGDIVWLEPGNRVPADVRLLWSHALEIDESLLTGESLGVLKDHEWSGPPATPVADRLNMAHAGTLVIRGRGKGIVVATGSRTVVGQLALDVLAAPPGKPPLIERMERFARAIAGTVLAAVAVVALIGVLVHSHGLTEMFTFAVALAVSAVPEGLPVALTVALAVATNRMARRGRDRSPPGCGGRPG
jgi:Ca2+-transporting ATPase